MQRVYCSKCGKVINENEENVSFKAKRWYGSRYDGKTIALDLCSECADEEIDNWNGVYPIIELDK